MKLKTGTLLQGGKYRIEKVLGQGGFGITYLAQQVNLDRDVAVKEFFMKDYCDRDDSTSKVTVGSSGSRDMVARYKEKFVKEAKSIAKLNHPNIVRIIDVFEENDTAYYVMEYLSEDSLSQLVKKQGRLSQADALKYIGQIASALEYIHSRNMLHLDVKPANVLLDEKRDAVLIDFGMAKHYDSEGNQTSTTPVGVSAGYAPFEQYSMSGKTVLTPAADIYSLGATLYKLLTGVTPPDASALIADPELMEYPSYMSERCVEVVRLSMDPVARKRPQTIADFMSLLDGSAAADDDMDDDVVDDDDENTVIDHLENQDNDRQQKIDGNSNRIHVNEKIDDVLKNKPAAAHGQDTFVNPSRRWSKLLPSSKRAFLYALLFYSIICLLWTVNLVRCADMKEYTNTALIFGFSAGTCLLSVICLMTNLRIGLAVQVLMFVKFLIFLWYYCNYLMTEWSYTESSVFINSCYMPILALIPLLLTFAGVRMKNSDGVTRWEYMKTCRSSFIVKCLNLFTLFCLMLSYWTILLMSADYDINFFEGFWMFSF